MLLANKIELDGTYDSGSQISLINAKLIKTMGTNNDANKIFMKTVNGVKSTDGLVTMRIKIFEIEEEVDVFIIEKEDFEDFIIGLDMIKKFKLIQDENLNITQKKKIDENIKIDDKDRKITQYSVNFNEYVNEDEFEIELEHLEEKKRER